MKVIPYGKPLGTPGNYISDSPGSYQWVTIEEVVMLTLTCAVVVIPSENNLVVDVIDPLNGVLLHHYSFPIPLGPTRRELIFPHIYVYQSSLVKLSDTKVGVLIETTQYDSADNFSHYCAATITIDGEIHMQSFHTMYTALHTQDTGGSYFDHNSKTLEIMYWDKYFTDFPYQFRAWRFSVNFNDLSVEDGLPIYPNMGANPYGEMAVCYYATCPLPSNVHGGAIGLVPIEYTVDEFGRFTIYQIGIVDNFGNTLGELPRDPTGNYYLNDRFISQIDTTNDIGITYSFYNPDLPPDFYWQAPGNMEIRCCSYQIQPTFQQLQGDVFQVEWKYDYPYRVPTDPLKTVPYDISKYFTPSGAKIYTDTFGASFLPPDEGPNTAELLPYQSYRQTGDHFNRDTFLFDPRTKGYFPGSFFGPNIYQYGSSFGSYYLLASTQADVEGIYPLYKAVVRNSYQLYKIIDTGIPRRLNQRNDGAGVVGHPRLQSATTSAGINTNRLDLGNTYI